MIEWVFLFVALTFLGIAIYLFTTNTNRKEDNSILGGVLIVILGVVPFLCLSYAYYPSKKRTSDSSDGESVFSDSS